MESSTPLPTSRPRCNLLATWILNEEGQADDEHRHRCLVRWLIKKRLQNRDDAHVWLNGYADDRGRHQKGWNELHPQSSLEADVRIEWSLGNRGEPNEWRQTKKE